MRRSIPSLNWLRVFEAAARTESFARAAEILHMSTSAVSQQIKSLERHLDTTLFQRGQKHVKLTEAGHAFLPVVRQSLVSVEETADALFGANKANTLTLQATLIFGTAWLSPRLPAFVHQHPEVRLHLTGAYSDEDFQRQGAELRIHFGTIHRSWGQCDRLFDEDIYPVAIPEIAASIQSPQDLIQHRLIQISMHHINWNQILQSLDMPPPALKQLSFTDTTEMALTMAASGFGVALARRPTTDWMVSKLGLAPCLIPNPITSHEAYFLVYRNLETLSPAAHAFRRWLLQQVNRYV